MPVKTHQQRAHQLDRLLQPGGQLLRSLRWCRECRRPPAPAAALPTAQRDLLPQHHQRPPQPRHLRSQPRPQLQPLAPGPDAAACLTAHLLEPPRASYADRLREIEQRRREEPHCQRAARAPLPAEQRGLPTARPSQQAAICWSHHSLPPGTHHCLVVPWPAPRGLVNLHEQVSGSGDECGTHAPSPLGRSRPR